MSDLKKEGRPEKEIKRKKRKEFLLTDEEYKKLDKLFSDSSYQNMNYMIRDILLENKYEVITLDQNLRAEILTLIEQSRRIGNNFNQLIKHFNQKKLTYFTSDEIKKLLNTLEEIKHLYGAIENKIK